jgi:glycine betaine catabolism B
MADGVSLDKMAERFSLELIKKEKVAKDTYSFFFDLSNKSEFKFFPGQYVRMILPSSSPDERGTSRFFTISSSPSNRDYLKITTKILASTFKMSLGSLEIGQVVNFFGPMGSFVLNDDEKNPRIYLAGGIGLTPFYSMLCYSKDKGVNVYQTLFVSFSSVEELLFYDELSVINKKNKYLKSVFTISRPDKTGDHWQGESGRITEELIKKHCSLVGSEIYYICGPTVMVDSMREMVEEMGVADDMIRIENFSGY